MADVTQVGGGDVAVIAGDAETLAICVYQLTRIDIGPIAAHHTIVLKALQPLGHDGDEIAPCA